MSKLIEVRLRGIDNQESEVIIPIRDISIITGKNGAGKSRFLRVLKFLNETFGNNDFDKPESQKLSFCPLVIESPNFLIRQKFNVGFVFETPYFLDKKLCLELEYLPLEMPLQLEGLSEPDEFIPSTFELVKVSGSLIFDSQKLEKLFSFKSKKNSYFSDIDELFIDASMVIENLKVEWSPQENTLINDGFKGFNSEEELREYLDSYPSDEEEDLYRFLKDFYKSYDQHVKDLQIFKQPILGEFPNCKIQSISSPHVLGSTQSRLIHETVFNESDLIPVKNQEYLAKWRFLDLREITDIESKMNFKTLFILAIVDSDKRLSEISKLTNSKINQKINKGETLLGDLKTKFFSLEKSQFESLEEQILAEDFPRILGSLEHSLRYGLAQIEINDYHQFSSGQPNIPAILHDQFLKSDFRRVEKGTYIKKFIDSWLKRFDIGDSLTIESTPSFFEVFINRGASKVNLSALSRGEKGIVYFILTIVNKVYPTGGLITLRESFIKLGKSQSIPVGRLEPLINNIENLLSLYDEMFAGQDVSINAEYLDEKVPIIRPYSSSIIIKEEYIYLEEPEAHLHPNNQSLLADLIIDAYCRFGLKIIVETHSEYLIRKIQYWVKRRILKPRDVYIAYMEKGSKELLRDLEITPSGTFRRNFGEGFLDEATRWKFELLKAENLN